jgi:hypothetical protein
MIDAASLYVYMYIHTHPPTGYQCIPNGEDKHSSSKPCSIVLNGEKFLFADFNCMYLFVVYRPGLSWDFVVDKVALG